MDVTLAQRLKKLPPYLFADLRRKIAQARANGVQVINLGIGDPDRPTPDPVVDELCRAVRDVSDPNRHRYGCDVPVAAFPQAVRDFYARRYGVALSEDMVLPTMGSKDAIAKLGLALLDPGDTALIPVPGYPIYNIGHVFAGAASHPVRLLAQNGFLPDLEAIPDAVARRAKLLWLNYPNNPTTATADLDFFRRAVDFARTHEILICHDSAYAENAYDGYRAPSILQVEGAADVAVEFFSLSKAFNMTGWRVGALAGHPGALRAVGLVKDNIDNGTLRAVQFAAAKALSVAEEVTGQVNAVYQRRRDRVVDALRAAGWPVDPPRATIYVWAPVPDKYAGSSAAFASDLLERAGVVVTPGLGYGEWGEGYYRISLTYPDEVLDEALGRIRDIGAS